ncbi:DUF1428 domain-containing protein [Halomonas huangheensis]|uniref:RNA signal recognition particle 4.5S RNA n=1 Tax=Halomonas huangheensis TaxID=1178482 RepID=W1N7V6_9GAMM|nr:DUF1428 domain-containing protein [Halomonas huangheensis]ALM54424.1 RNA signal recognition particle [Halomonas huangheensis]ERL50990.1 hypothetical protein BJB45_20570 [Halomonas huangheensis]
MSYVEGFVAAVPESNKQAYLDLATAAADIFKRYGATRVVEAWGAEVPEGKVTDFHRAVQAEPGEVIVYSWIEYPSKQVRDESFQKMEADNAMDGFMGDAPFDGKRLIYGGFDIILDV